jgi:GT2 family glycosyltransferase
MSTQRSNICEAYRACELTLPKRPHPELQTIAVVLNWNGYHDTIRCVKSVLDISGDWCHVLIVDNGSTDASLHRLQRLQSTRVSILALPENKGFAGGMNAGLRWAATSGAHHIWFVNNDVIVLPGCADALRRAAASAGEAILTPVIKTSDGRFQHVGGTYGFGATGIRQQSAADFEQNRMGTLWLSGTALYMRVETALRLEGFHEPYFAYWEDVDISLRALNASIALLVVHDAHLIHLGSQSTGGTGSAVSEYLIARNEYQIVRRFTRPDERRNVLVATFARQLRLCGRLWEEGKRDTARAILHGGWRGLRGERGCPPPKVHARRSIASAMLRHPWRLAELLDAHFGGIHSNAEP